MIRMHDVRAYALKSSGVMNARTILETRGTKKLLQIGPGLEEIGRNVVGNNEAMREYV
jgi:hypothetical protein